MLRTRSCAVRARRAVAAVALLACAMPAAAGGVIPIEFSIDDRTSGLLADVNLSATTSGTLIGNWDPVNNPTGTRTKPGLFGSFGDTENLPVDTSINPAIEGQINSSSSGGFSLTLDTGANTIAVSGFNANLLTGGAAVLPAIAEVSFESFRTRNPTSTYFGATVDFPLGDANITTLTAAQNTPQDLGTVTPLGGGQFSFLIFVSVNLVVSGDFLGNGLPEQTIPALLPLEGFITVDEVNGSATLSSSRELNLAQQQDVNQSLPQFPFGLPTILPPGQTANVLFDLLVGQVSFDLTGTLTTNASGAIVPAPGAAAVVFAALTGVCSRRRRRA